MRKIFDVDSPLAKAMNMLANVIVLSVLWLVGCIPVVTAGASTAAAYYAARQSGEPGESLWKRYWRAFHRDWRQAVCVELLCLIPAASLLGGAYILTAVGDSVPVLLSGAYGVLLYLAAAFLSCVFPLLSYFDYPTGTLLKNALLIAFANPGWTFLTVLTGLLPLLLAMLPPVWLVRILPLVTALVPGAVIRINSAVYARVFRKYVRPEEKTARTQT